MSAVENFPILLSDAEEESSAVPPCFSHEGVNVRWPSAIYLSDLHTCFNPPPRLPAPRSLPRWPCYLLLPFSLYA